MSAPESAAVPVAAEEVKPVEATPVVVDTKTEEPAAVAEDVTPAVVEAEAATEEPAAAEEPAKPETKAEGEAKPPKSPGFLAKILNNFKGERKAKGPKSPKKEKKKEEVEAAATAEAPKETAVEVPAEVSTEVPVETAKEVEPIVAEPAIADVPTVVADEVKETAVKVEAKASKVGRRLSARVGDFFRPKAKTELTTPAKVDEHPPRIEKPEEIGPLDNPATEAAKAEEAAKPVEAATPVVAATA